MDVEIAESSQLFVQSKLPEWPIRPGLGILEAGWCQKFACRIQVWAVGDIFGDQSLELSGVGSADVEEKSGKIESGLRGRTLVSFRNG